jgi:predicted metalloendopeptidase
MAFETEIAKVSLPRAELREPKKLYHRVELAGLEKTAPKFAWKAFLAGLGFPSITQINAHHPPYYAGIDALVAKTPLADVRTYLKWHRLHAAAATSALPKAFVDENFAFYGKTLQGTAQILPRWKRCVQLTDHLMGEALARPFVRLKFGPDAKSDTQTMVKNIESAMEKNLADLAWMDDATRKQAYEKLRAIVNKIGYPDKWRNYDSLEVKPGDFMSSVMGAARFESKRDLNKIGKPLDRGEWQMSPPTVNAYYEPSLNEMVFPAGILQPPFYAKSAHPAVNYGAIGMVIGHELTHGFDDEGRQFDAKGNLRDWWTPTVNGEFEKRATCVKEQYDAYTVLDNVHLNGKLTLGENIADLGGIKLAYAAYVSSRNGKPAQKVGAFTDDQLFFLGTAQAWCGKRREALVRMRVVNDPHSPPEYRINGPLSNLPEFAKAFSCKPSDKMVRQNACVVW